MNLELKISGATCSTKTFVVNGVQADAAEFGEQYDQDQENADEDCACGDMQFNRKDSTDEVLEKYSITEAEYREIAEKLEEGLSFGCCGWCV